MALLSHSAMGFLTLRGDLSSQDHTLTCIPPEVSTATLQSSLPGLRPFFAFLSASNIRLPPLMQTDTTTISLKLHKEKILHLAKNIACKYQLQSVAPSNDPGQCHTITSTAELTDSLTNRPRKANTPCTQI